MQDGNGISYSKVMDVSDEIIDGVTEIFKQTIRTNNVKVQWNITERLDIINKQISQYQMQLNAWKVSRQSKSKTTQSDKITSSTASSKNGSEGSGATKSATNSSASPTSNSTQTK